MSTEALIEKMRAGVKETYDICLRELVIPVRVLSVDEINEIRRQAKSYAARFQGDETDVNLAIQKLTLSKASDIAGVPLLNDRFYKESRMTVDEINYLYNEYIRVMDTVNPSLEQITPEQFRALVDALKKKNVSASDLSLRQLKAICTAFVALIQKQDTQTSQGDNTSGGQQ